MFEFVLTQRFGSALNLNLHMLAFDGVYAADENDHPQFHALLTPEDDEIVHLTASLAERIAGLLDRRGLGPDSDPQESETPKFFRSQAGLRFQPQ
jgi:hypothetical protein